MIVDDQAPFRDAARAVLKTIPGFAVIGTAETGEEGLALARSLRPALVLLDVSLPDLNGVEVSRTLADQQVAPVVVLVSTYDVSEWGEEVARCGAIGYLSKSDFNADRLLELLDGGHG